MNVVGRGWVLPEESGRVRARGWRAIACGVALALGLGHAGAAAPGDATQERLALGLIVKLKDTKVNSVVRLPASVRPSDTAQAQRLRMAAAANRKRVGFLMQKPTAYGAHVIHPGHYTTVAEAEAEAAKLRLDPDVEWVAVNQMEKAAATGVQFPSTPDGAYATHKWLQRRSEVGPGVAGFRDAWARLNNASKTGSVPLPLDLSPVVVAVLDTGKLTHPDLDARMLPGYDFVSEVEFARDGNGLDANPTDPGDYLLQSEINGNPALYGTDCKARSSSWHGASVMSMLTPLASSTFMGPGALSMLPETVAKVLPVRIGGTCGALVSDIIEGMLWAAGVDYQGAPARNPNPARVINISFGGSGNCQSNGTGDTLYRQTIATLRTKGTLVVASAGNGSNTGEPLGYVGPTRPASCAGVMAVTALRYDGSKASYANTVNGALAGGYHGLSVAGGDIVRVDGQPDIPESLNLMIDSGSTTARGIVLESASCGAGGCSVSEGTSFAAPQVAAVAALVLSVRPGLTVDELVAVLLNTATRHRARVDDDPLSCDDFPASGGPGSVPNCICTTATCGTGVLDADAALASAIAAASNVNAPFNSPELRADYFTPNRLQTTNSNNGGGGGATDDLGLAALAVVALTALMWRWRSATRVRVRATGQAVFRSGRR